MLLDSLPSIEYIYDQFPDDEIIARRLADEIKDQPISQRNFPLLNEIVNRFDLDVGAYGLPEIGESKIKSSYNVAVLLPFMFDNLENTYRVERNKFVMELYAGMMMAVDTLNYGSSGLNVYPYDTKRDIDVTEAIFEKPEMQSMDLIVGPLFPGPLKVANDFSYSDVYKRQDRLDLRFSTKGELEEVSIAPLILLPFVDNCFKHGAGDSIEECFVHFELKMEAGALDLVLTNSTSEKVVSNQNSGIGLDNVKRRLEGEYPGKYELNISQSPGVYEVKLKLDLNEEI